MLHSETLYVQYLSLTLSFCLYQATISPQTYRNNHQLQCHCRRVFSSEAATSILPKWHNADFAQTLKRSITFAARLKGCLDELKHQAFPTRSWRLCVSRKKKRKEEKNKLGTRGGKIEHINWLEKWESLSLTPLSEWTIKISNIMFKAVGQASW